MAEPAILVLDTDVLPVGPVPAELIKRLVANKVVVARVSYR